jgi:hypothetical protein
MKITLTLSIIILCSSCAVVYFPNTRNAPMFSGKGEFQASVSTGLGSNLQTAYAITNHIGIMANGMSTTRNMTFYGGQHQYGEFGIGYYQNIKTKKVESLFYADVFGGYGKGNVDVYDDGGPKTLVTHSWFQGSYQKFFIQPCIAFKFNQTEKVQFHISLVDRLSFVDVSGISGLASSASKNKASATPIAFNKTVYFFHEPSFVVKAVLREFYITSQIGLNLPYKDYIDHFTYNPIQLSIGIGILLNFKKKK